MLQVQQDANEALDAIEEKDDMDGEGDMEKHRFELYKPKADVPKPMPVIIGSFREENLIETMDGLGYATVIWHGKYNVGKSTIKGFDVCKKNHSLAVLFGKILDAIEADPDLDKNKIVATGFSATAKAAMLFTCHADRLTGIYASCSGFEVTNPGRGCGMSTASACNSVNIKRNFKRTKVKPYKGQCEDCQKAVLTNCEVKNECEIKGAYPCYKKKPFVVVAQTGVNDYYKYASDLLYEAAKAEGLDARYQLWKMGHNKPPEIGAVIMGTFGFGEYCPPECEEAVKTCINGADWLNLKWCLAKASKYRPTECPKFCVPTMSMLSLAERTFLRHDGIYGPVQKMIEARPSTSKCSYDDYKR